jgi:hypothetical protein
MKQRHFAFLIHEPFIFPFYSHLVSILADTTDNVNLS